MAEAPSFQLAQAVGGARVVRAGARVPLTAAQAARATLVQQGNDLLIVQPDGTTVQVSGYFATANRLDLQLADGQVLTRQAIEGGIGVAPTPLIQTTLPSSPLAASRGAAGSSLSEHLRTAADTAHEK